MLYANLDTNRIERVEQAIVVLDERVKALRVELTEYLAESPHCFQHSPRDVPRGHRQPTLYEYVGTLRVNSVHLTKTLAGLQDEIARGSVGVNV